MADPLPFDPIAEAQRHWRRRWGAAPATSMGAVTSVMRAQQILLARLNALLRPLDLTFPRYEALMLLYLSRRGSLPLGKMGERLQVHATSVTSIVDALERSGFVQRSPHERDRRTTLASITDEGRATAEAATEILNGASFGIGALGRQDLNAVTELLRRLREDAGDFAEA